jgi:hypothetical protein
MNELKMPGMEGDTGNSPLQRFLRVVLSVPDDRVADG